MSELSRRRLLWTAAIGATSALFDVSPAPADPRFRARFISSGRRAIAMATVVDPQIARVDPNGKLPSSQKKVVSGGSGHTLTKGRNTYHAAYGPKRQSYKVASSRTTPVRQREQGSKWFDYMDIRHRPVDTGIEVPGDAFQSSLAGVDVNDLVVQCLMHTLVSGQIEQAINLLTLILAFRRGEPGQETLLLLKRDLRNLDADPSRLGYLELRTPKEHVFWMDDDSETVLPAGLIVPAGDYTIESGDENGWTRRRTYPVVAGDRTVVNVGMTSSLIREKPERPADDAALDLRAGESTVIMSSPDSGTGYWYLGGGENSTYTWWVEHNGRVVFGPYAGNYSAPVKLSGRSDFEIHIRCLTGGGPVHVCFHPD